MLERIRPSLAERKRMNVVSSSIIARIDDLARSCGIAVKTMLVGSAARGTWLSGDHDLDIFLGVACDDDLLKALDLARSVASDHREKYAEHPYVHAMIEGFDVDLVPCYLVDEASHLKSAVDRTPFHNRYVSQRIAGIEDDVLLLKQFMKGVKVYGSELRVGGFSGYLSELLVLFYGSFPDVLQAASYWRPGLCLDIEGHGSKKHEDPLVVVDPVDPGRNVAAALTLDKMLQFSAAARSFISQPNLEFFFPKAPDPISDEEFSEVMAARGTLPILIDFAAPDVVEDVLFPQLRKAESSVRSLLERSGFSLLRSDVSAYGERALMLFELEVWQLSRACRRAGPPVWQAEHLTRFLAAHAKVLSGPYISEGKVIVEETRTHTSAAGLLASEMENLSLGKHLSASIRSGYDMYVGSELLAIKDERFRIYLSEYFKAETRVF